MITSQQRPQKIPPRRRLRRNFEQSASSCQTWADYRRRVGRLIASSDTMQRQHRDGFRTSAWRLARQVWSIVHPEPDDATPA